MADHIIPELDRKGLREFGFVTGGIVAVLFGLFFPWLLGRTIPVWPWVLCAVLIIIGLISGTRNLAFQVARGFKSMAGLIERFYFLSNVGFDKS